MHTHARTHTHMYNYVKTDLILWMSLLLMSSNLILTSKGNSCFIQPGLHFYSYIPLHNNNTVLIKLIAEVIKSESISEKK